MTLDPGKYIVLEVSQAGWKQSVPGGSDIVAATGTGLGDHGFAITLTSGQQDTDNNFGNFQQATKSGVKFNDLDGAGTGTTGPGLAGWTIEAFTDSDGNGTLSQSEFAAGPAATALTGAGASYSTTDHPGKYIVLEVSQAGWKQSVPGGSDIVAATGTGLGDHGFAITLTSGQQDTDNNFGNFQQATKSGVKFNDLDGAGTGTTGPGLAGWTIEAFTDSDGNGTLSQSEFAAGPAATALTGAGGSYSMTLDPGKYIVLEVSQAGWKQSVPGGSDIVAATGTGLGDHGFAITLTSGQQATDNTFCPYPTPFRSGVKFNDLDGAGTGTTGPGLAGWTIEAFTDSDGNGTLSQSRSEERRVGKAITGGGGRYSMEIDAGNYSVVEVRQAGWKETVT